MRERDLTSAMRAPATGVAAKLPVKYEKQVTALKVSTSARGTPQKDCVGEGGRREEWVKGHVSVDSGVGGPSCAWGAGSAGECSRKAAQNVAVVGAGNGAGWERSRMCACCGGWCVCIP